MIVAGLPPLSAAILTTALHPCRTGMIVQEHPDMAALVASCDLWLSAVCQLCQRQLKACNQRVCWC